jgi:hypothetical protein
MQGEGMRGGAGEADVMARGTMHLTIQLSFSTAWGALQKWTGQPTMQGEGMRGEADVMARGLEEPCRVGRRR